MPRFVVLLHETPAGYSRGTHFDLMLEHGDALRTWALDKLPLGGETIIAERLPDHRLVYLDFQGQISGERGGVSRVDRGKFESIKETETEIVVRLNGGLQGTLTLTQDAENPHLWRVSLSGG